MDYFDFLCEMRDAAIEAAEDEAYFDALEEEDEMYYEALAEEYDDYVNYWSAV